MHVKQNKYYRSIAFKFLLCLSFLSYILIYSFGIVHLIQKCDDNIENETTNLIKCSENYLKFRDWAYIIGFYINSREDTIFIEAWYHLFLAILISFDVYVQKIENYFNEKSEENRKKYRRLSNENTKLKPLTFGEDNILMNIGYGIKKAEEEMEQENTYDEILKNSVSGEKGDEKNIKKSTRLRARKKQKIKDIIDKKEEE